MSKKKKGDKLDYREVLHFWAETKIGVGKMPKGFAPTQKGGMNVDMHGTRQMCARIVETHEGYTEELGNLLVRYMFQGVPEYEQMERCEVFKDSFAKSVADRPVYLLFLTHGARVEPQEYTLTKLKEELGFKHVQECKRFMERQHMTIFGLGRDRGRWYLGAGVLAILKKNSKKEEHLDSECVKISVKYEGVTASEC